MQCIVELINELKGLDEQQFAARFSLPNLHVAYHRKHHFDNWLRRCLEPGQEFVNLDEAWDFHEKSFG